MSEQITFETNEFAINPTQRCPCVLLLDVSGSMGGRPLEELNAGLVTFRDELSVDSYAVKTVDLAIITFGPVKIEMPFTNASTFAPPTLQAQGDTPTGAAIMQALSMIEDRKTTYRDNGIRHYRPWVFLITDGKPTDSWQTAAAAIREGEASKKFSFFAIGVKGADIDTLRKISVRDPLSLNDLRFRDLFCWLSNSLGSVSKSTPGTEVALQAPKGWASV